MNISDEKSKRELPYLCNEDLWDDICDWVMFLLQSCEEYEAMPERRGNRSLSVLLFLEQVEQKTVELEQIIAKRAQKNEISGISIPLFTFFSICQCNKLEQFSVIVAAAAAFDTDLRQKMLLLEQESTQDTPTKGLILRLYSLLQRAYGKETISLIQPGGDFSLCLKKMENSRGENPQKEVIFIKKGILSYFLSGTYPVLMPQPVKKSFFPVYNSFEKVKEQICHIYKKGLQSKDTVVLYLYGEEKSGKKQGILQAAEKLGQKPVFLSWKWLCSLEQNKKEELLEDLEWINRLHHCIVCIMDIPSSEETEKEKDKNWNWFLLSLGNRTFSFLCILGQEKNDFVPIHSCCFTVLKMPVLSLGEKISIWRQYQSQYQTKPCVDANLNGNKYILNAAAVGDVFETAQILSGEEEASVIGPEEISDAVRQWDTGTLGEYATNIPCVFSWDDLILEENVKNQLYHITNHIRFRSVVGEEWGFFEKTPYGTGNSVLFYGPPGTGKTMAAQVMASELGLELYRIDLSKMVSKYIGETEKNISSLFEKAKHMNVILFFDEADALFAKRSDVKDSNDRNANAETAHLLQKLEEYEGLVLLATNLVEQIDDAFRRRIRFMVPFRFPDSQTRKKLWHTILPEKAPKSRALDLDFFAQQFELSGSQIKEVILNAAFLAAAEQKPLDNEHIKKAIFWNYEKYGKKLVKEDFGYLI